MPVALARDKSAQLEYSNRGAIKNTKEKVYERKS
jgi:hypothetical protein